LRQGLSTQYGFVDAITLQEITAADYALGADACMARHPYHRGLKGTIDRRIKCEGKNVFDDDIRARDRLDTTTGALCSAVTTEKRTFCSYKAGGLCSFMPKHCYNRYTMV
jgi:hypothetical protein